MKLIIFGGLHRRSCFQDLSLFSCKPPPLRAALIDQVLLFVLSG